MYFIYFLLHFFFSLSVNIFLGLAHVPTVFLFWYQTALPKRKKLRGEADDRDRQNACLNAFDFSRVGRGQSQQGCRLCFCVGKRSLLKTEGEETSRYTQLNRHKHAHTNKYIDTDIILWTQGLEAIFFFYHTKTVGKNTDKYAHWDLVGHTANKPSTCTKYTHTHTHSLCKWALRRLHGMWHIPSSSAHILFPDQTRARLLGKQHGHWWKISECRCTVVFHPQHKLQTAVTFICFVFFACARQSLFWMRLQA